MFTETVITGAILQDGTHVWASGSGEIVFQATDGTQSKITAHDGALLSATPAPDKMGLISGGDDGRLVLSKPDGSTLTLYEKPGAWIEPVIASPVSGFVACGAGKDVISFEMKTPEPKTILNHDVTVMGLAFHPNGRRIATAHKGGASLWYARGIGQSAVKLKWDGAHLIAAWSPDGRFVITAMHDNTLHGWKIDDKTDMRMAGYPSRIKSLAWLDGGKWLVTAGAQGAVIWPFDGKNGPMGRAATEVGFSETGIVTAVCAVQGQTFAAGTSDGRVWIADLATQHQHLVSSGQATITCLASDGHRLIWGDSKGNTGHKPISVQQMMNS